MSERLINGAIIVSALGSGLVAGIFYAFSTFVMAALGRLPAPQGIAAMQSINIAVINPMFLILFMGLALPCLALGVFAAMHWHDPRALYLLGAGLLYVLGTIGVTMGFNVPLNNALAAVDPAGAEGAALWTRYLRDWTFWNHIRTVAPTLAMLLYVLAARLPSH